MNKKHALNTQGLTLIELMLAVSLVAVGFVLLLGAIPAMHGTIKTSRDIAQAVHNGTMIAEEIKALPSTAFETYIPPVMNDLGADEVITVTVLDNAGNEVALPTDLSAIPAGVPDPVEVLVHVQWTDVAGRPKTTTVSTKKSIS